MADETTPLTRKELDALLESALGEIGDDTAAAVWERYRIEPQQVKCARFGDDSVHATWVVAAAGEERLGYDDVEKEFGTGVLGSQKVLRQWGTWGSLRNALLHFPEDS